MCTLTLDNGKTLELPTVAGGASILQDVEIEMDVAYQTYRRFAYYNIKEKELKKFKKNGVSQIDVQLSPANYTIAFGQDQLGSLLLSSMNVIKGVFGK